MGIGVVGIQTSQKKEQPGPPFASNSANNGLSVDTVSGRIVLGNDVGAVGAPAQLLSDREIFMDNGLFLFRLLFNSPSSAIVTTIDGTQILITGADTTTPLMSVIGGDDSLPTINITGTLNAIATLALQAGAGGSTLISSRVVANVWQIENPGTGDFFIGWTNAGAASRNMGFYGATFQIQVGPTLVTKNTADFQISGTTTYRRLVESTGAATFNVDRDLDSGKLFRNSAAVNFQLPSMAGALSRPGFVFRCRVFNAAGVTVTAPGGDTINFGSLVTSASGTLFSTDIGACITITYDVDGWVTESFVGAWGLT